MTAKPITRPILSASPSRKSLSAVIVCVGYADKLRLTLPHNLPLLTRIIVVTTSNDIKTQNLVREYLHWGASATKLVISDRCYANDASFNKGAMLNAGLAALVNPDWIIFTDADVFLSDRLPSLMADCELNPECFYSTNRFDIPAESVERWRAGRYFDHAVIPSGKNDDQSGYFQMWNRNASVIRDAFPKCVSDAFPSAGGLDTHFYCQWDFANVVHLPQLTVHHIEHSDSPLAESNGHVAPKDRMVEHRRTFGKNWNGPHRKPGTWRQFGQASREGMVIFTTEENQHVGGLEFVVIRMKTAQSNYFTMPDDENIPIEIIEMQLPTRPGDKPTLLFLGEDMGREALYIGYRVPVDVKRLATVRPLKVLEMPRFGWLPDIRNVQIQTHSRCNADCLFCPYIESDHVKHPGRMADETWKRILVNLAPFKVGLEKGKIIPYLMNEPLIDPSIFDKIGDIYRAFPRTCVEVSTNGMALTEKTVDRLFSLFDGKRHDLWVSHHGIDASTLEHIMKIDYERATANLISLLKTSAGRFTIKIRGAGESKAVDKVFFTRQQYLDYWEKLLTDHHIDRRNVSVDAFQFHDRAGTLHREDRGANLLNRGKVRDIGPGYAPFHCPRIDEWVHVMHDGKIRLCCMDYGAEVDLPNINDISLLDYFHSKEYVELVGKVSGRTLSEQNFICSRCISPGG